MGLDVRQQVPMPFIYKEDKQEVGYKIDLLVNNKVIIELKAVEILAPVHYSQVLTYLKLSGIKLGLLINFNAKTLKDNIHRIVNRYNLFFCVNSFAIFAWIFLFQHFQIIFSHFFV